MGDHSPTKKLKIAETVIRKLYKKNLELEKALAQDARNPRGKSANSTKAAAISRLEKRLQVCILPTGEAQPAICIETPREATLDELKHTIEAVVGLPTHRQRLVWFHAKDDGD
ncbi:hypothetical protein DYB26_011698, partial [Aphanomyces astaci]